MEYTLQAYKPVAILSLKMCLNISTLKTQLHNLQYYVFFKVCRPLSDPWTWITVVVSAMFYKLMCVHYLASRTFVQKLSELFSCCFSQNV